MLIKDIFEKDIRRTIDGVIKADDERHLANEVSEYVLTPDIRKHLHALLESYNEGGAINGVWISGFFGSGKSHLLKMISHLLENKSVEGVPVAKSFELKAKDDDFLVGEIRKAVRIPSRSILFNIDQKAPAGAADEAILHVFVNVFNELRGYDKAHGWIADLEHALDERGLYASFKAAFHKEMGGGAEDTWENLRGMVSSIYLTEFANAYAQVIGISTDEASKVLDRQAHSYKVSIESFAEKVNAYILRQPAGFRLNFFVDEVGQFIGDNNRRMLNLQTIAESLSSKCSGRAWIFVTSQGNLENVIGAWKNTTGDDFTKIQGRFKTRINLTSKDIDQVICHRLLEKKPSAHPDIRSLYAKEKENLRTLFVFSDNMAKFRPLRDDDDFVLRYPFMPYQFELFELVLQGLSRQNWFTGKHASIGERSMLGVFQEVAKAIDEQTVGKLATFDIMFEGLRSVLRGDLQTLIQQAEGSFGNTSIEARLLKLLFLVKPLGNTFCGTPRNLAILLIDDCEIDIAAHEKEVVKRLEKLAERNYIRRTADTFEFLTNEEKDLENDIRAVSLQDRESFEFLQKTVWGDILTQSKLRYEALGIDYEISRRIDETPYGKEHDIGVHLLTPDHPDFNSKSALAARGVRSTNDLFVVLDLDSRLLDDITQYRKTEKFLQQNNSPSLAPAKQSLFRVKSAENLQLGNSIRLRLTDALRRAPIHLGGTDLDIGENDPRTRIARAFQSLVTSAFRHLKMIKVKVGEDDVRKTLEAPSDELFAGNDATLSEAEAETLAILKREKTAGRSLTVKDLADKLEKPPYGWRGAIASRQIAGLVRRGKIELRIKSTLLAGSKITDALLNDRTSAEATIIVQEDYDATTVKKLKDFHFELFNETNPGNDAGEVVSRFQAALGKRIEGVKEVYAARDGFPFYAPLGTLIAELEPLLTRDRDYYFGELPKKADALLDAKEAAEPILQFHRGDNRTFVNEIRAFLRDEAASLHALTETKVAALSELAVAKKLPAGPAIVKAKATLRELADELKSKKESARAEALQAVADKASSARHLDDFAAIPAAAAESLISQAQEDAFAAIRAASSLDDIRRAADAFQHHGFSRLAEALHKRASAEKFKYPDPKASDRAAPGAARETPAAESFKMVAARKLKPAWDKPVLENLADLDGYLAALRATYAAELQQKKRIQL